MKDEPLRDGLFNLFRHLLKEGFTKLEGEFLFEGKDYKVTAYKMGKLIRFDIKER